MTMRCATLPVSQVRRLEGSKSSALCIGPMLMDRLLFEADGNKDLYPGGNAVITSAVLARRGIRTGVMGQVGADSHGERIRALLEHHRVNTSCLHLAPGIGTKVSNIIIRPDGSWYRDSADPEIFPYLDACSSFFLPADCIHLHVGGLNALLRSAPEPTLNILRAARRAGCSISIGLTSSPCDSALLRESIEPTDLLLCTLDEFSFLVAEKSQELPDITKMLERFPLEECVITLGARGAIFKWHGSVGAYEAKPRSVARNTLGAGDIFAGVLIAARLRLRSLTDSLRGAAEAATKSVFTSRWDDSLAAR